MHGKKQFGNLVFKIICRAATAVFAIGVALALTEAMTPTTQAQTYAIIHSFSGGADGSHPDATMVMDSEGNLYGTTRDGGRGGHGTVFRLTYENSGWLVTPVYPFRERGGDAAWPAGALLLGADGTLFGTANFAEGGGCCGRVFHLTPPPTAPRSTLNLWNETTIHQFTGAPDGDTPAGPLTPDSAGNVYLTTQLGGQYNAGAVIELSPSDGGWTETILYSFTGYADGQQPIGGVIFDHSGNLYGTTFYGGNTGLGTVFKLSPSGNGWTESVLYNFQGGSDGADPTNGLVRDDSGNLYGATSPCTSPDSPDFYSPCTTIYMLSPSGGTWTLTVLYHWDGEGGVLSSMVTDAAGNIYGATASAGLYEVGSVFKLTQANGVWTYTSLHDFNGVDGDEAIGGLTLDSNNNLYGTTYTAGASGYYGVAFEITP